MKLDKVEPQNSSPSTSTSGLGKLSPEEMLYLASLPEELAKQLSNQEAAMLVRQPPRRWTTELRAKMKPYADEEMLESLK